LTASYTPTTFATTTDSVTFNGNLSNAALSSPNSVNLTLTGPTTAPVATVTLGAFSPASPVYGQTVTLSATVTSPLSPAPAGSVVFTVDSSTYPATLSSGTWTAQVSGLAVGPHTVSVAYTSSNGYAPGNAGPATLTVVPLNVTSSVSVTGTSGLVYNRVTHIGTESITITNTSGATINGPLQLLLAISNSAVTASNASGTYLGNPYWTSASSLAPGASVTITVQFSYALGTTFTTTPSVYSGGI
jgi:hypothetical protein